METPTNAHTEDPFNAGICMVNSSILGPVRQASEGKAAAAVQVAENINAGPRLAAGCLV